MLIVTFAAFNYLNTVWNQPNKQSIDDRMDQYVKNFCITLCISAVIPFTICYDIGHKIGKEYCRSEEVVAAEPVAPLRRSARLAEKRAKQL